MYLLILTPHAAKRTLSFVGHGRLTSQYLSEHCVTIFCKIYSDIPGRPARGGYASHELLATAPAERPRMHCGQVSQASPADVLALLLVIRQMELAGGAEGWGRMSAGS